METTWTAKATIPKGSTEEQRDAILNALAPLGDTSADAGDQLGDCCNATMSLIECPTSRAVRVSFYGCVDDSINISISFQLA